MKYLTILMLLVFALGCKKSDILTYHGADGISFYITYFENPDSINYSFALQPTQKQRDTVLLNMRLVGKISANARTFKLRATDSSTARNNIDYILPDMKLPANQMFVKYPLIVLNSPEMKTKSFKLLLEVAPGAELVAGAPGIATDLSANLKRMKVNITGQLIKPDYWENVQFVFGTFSVTKFQFMIKTSGLTNFSPAVIGLGEIFRLQVTFRNALTAYEKVNGPLIDESGNRVIF
ncbi:DUF4843 domain-containing protein [Mucilaginibacter sp. RS28]|uniref:DUF4843 domain-containing protein n=1 Tax=Mucilaginibacter straminoryzae TaxID=2932774 RepID=A0A9X1X5V9_9SPHI|nr:DUF4843 domain-containing protein [Mucilaginibacter straminoryzae]MCJ8209209.1 DUF4843 domain-containing protein [Mucilaginibacter straminoryzae]